MSRRRDRRFSLGATALVLALSAGGCSLLIGSELSGKPAETTGVGGSGAEVTTGAGGNAGGPPGTTGTSATGSGGRPVGAGGEGPGGQGGSGGSGPMCPKGTADCDGNPMNACKTDLNSDPRNCGACGVVCQPPGGCHGGKCK
jgi:hypothetical protein